MGASITRERERETEDVKIRIWDLVSEGLSQINKDV
jgi:hypothetical protein